MSNDSSVEDDDHCNVVVLEEMDKDGYMVFQKVIKDVAEFKFYNPDHFASIGFPDAIITVIGEDGLEKPADFYKNPKMTGGKYANRDEVSWPFRQFVYLVQPSDDEPKNTTEVAKNDLGIYGLLFKPKDGYTEPEPKQESHRKNEPVPNNLPVKDSTEKKEDPSVRFSGLNGFMNKLSDMFKPTKPVEVKEVENKAIEEPPKEVVPPVAVEEPPKEVVPPVAIEEPPKEAVPPVAVEGVKKEAVPPVAVEEPPKEVVPPVAIEGVKKERGELKVIVKIPVLNDDDEEPISELSKSEKGMSKSEKGRYKIGKREIEMCVEKGEKIKEMVERVKGEKSRGTKMAKYKKLGELLSAP